MSLQHVALVAHNPAKEVRNKPNRAAMTASVSGIRWLCNFLMVGTAMAWQRHHETVQRLWDELQEKETTLDLSDPSLIQKYCDQKLDHFDPQNTKT